MDRRVIAFAEPRRVEIRSASLPAMDADSVLVQTTVTSISRGTELNLYNGRTRAIRGSWYAWYPLVPGYETVGRVLEVGENVTHVKAGDRVVGSSVAGSSSARDGTRGNGPGCVPVLALSGRTGDRGRRD